MLRKGEVGFLVSYNVDVAQTADTRRVELDMAAADEDARADHVEVRDDHVGGLGAVQVVLVLVIIDEAYSLEVDFREPRRTIDDVLEGGQCCAATTYLHGL